MCPSRVPAPFQSGVRIPPEGGDKEAQRYRGQRRNRQVAHASGHYVVVRRLSSKEEKRRIVPAVFDPEKVPCEKVGFENHLNVFHAGRKGLPANVAKGLAIFLGSTLADKWLRRFNGHTQINAGDLRVLRYPDLKTLAGWGAKVHGSLPSQEKIDELVEGRRKIVQN